MNRVRRAIGIALLIALGAGWWPVVPAHAQTAPLVVFIDDSSLLTSSVTDVGPDGVSRLAEIFRQYGAQTTWAALDAPLPADADVIVLVRPLKTLSGAQLARLWVQVARGSHLLLALDPAGLPVIRGEGEISPRTERSNSGIGRLLALVYGVLLENSFLAEPWFTTASITNQQTTLTTVYAEDIVVHPVMAPLARYDLPLLVWGAQTLLVEALGPGSQAAPLLVTRTGYGEKNPRVFPTTETPDPLEINIGQDNTGRLFVAALAENTALQSRVAVLGDSELVQNGYGLVTLPDDPAPLHLGNRLFAERLVAWLLGVPPDQWPDLPAGYTALALDGEADDWAGRPAVVTDATGDTPLGHYDIAAVRAVIDDSFLYLLVETNDPPPPDARLTFEVENTFDGIPDLQLAVSREGAGLVAGDMFVPDVPDGVLRTGAALEARIPVRVLGSGALVGHFCLADSRAALAAPPLDCVDTPPALVPTANTRAPATLRFPAGPRGTIHTPEGAVNLRASPSTDAPIVAVLPANTVVALTGRTAEADWLQVQAATYSGWLAEFLLLPNIAPENLPVVAFSVNAPPAAPAEAAPTAAAPATHVVQAGETLSSIAARYGVTVGELVAVNDLANPSQIVVGQVLVLP